MAARILECIRDASDVSNVDRALNALQSLSGSLAEIFPDASTADKDMIVQLFVYRPGSRSDTKEGGTADLLSVLNQTSTGMLSSDKNFEAARAQLYDVLSSVIVDHLTGSQKLGSRLANRPVFKAITFAAQKLLVRERGSTAQQNIAELLRKLLESDLIQPDDVRFAEIAKDCIEVASTTKVGATAKEHVFALLGQLVRLSPTSMPEYTRHIFRLSMHELSKEVGAAKHGSGAKSGIVSGCLRALTAVLQEQDDLVSGPEGQRHLDSIYEAAFARGTVIYTGQARFAVTEASLQMISAHSVLFRRRIRDDMGSLLPRLHALCHCKHDRALQVAPAALRAALEQVAEYLLLEATRTYLCVEVFRGDASPQSVVEAEEDVTSGSPAKSGAGGSADVGSASASMPAITSSLVVPAASTVLGVPAREGSGSQIPMSSAGVAADGSTPPGVAAQGGGGEKIDLRNLDDRLAAVSAVEGQHVVRSRDARVDFGLVFSLCVEMIKGEASPELGVAVRQLSESSGGLVKLVAVQALQRAHTEWKDANMVYGQLSSEAQSGSTQDPDKYYRLIRARDDARTAQYNCQAAAVGAVVASSGGGIGLRYRRKDDIVLGCQCLSSLAAVTYARFGDSVVQLLARRFPLIVRDSSISSTEAEGRPPEREHAVDLPPDRREHKKAASMSAVAKAECLATYASFRMLTCCQSVDPVVPTELVRDLSRIVSRYPFLSGARSGARLAVFNALHWLCEFVDVHPQFGGTLLPLIGTPMAQTALSRRREGMASSVMTHPITGRPVARLVFEMAPVILHMCKDPSGPLAISMAATRRHRAVATAAWSSNTATGISAGIGGAKGGGVSASVSSSSSTASPAEGFGRYTSNYPVHTRHQLLRIVLEVVTTVLAQVDLGLAVTGSTSLDSNEVSTEANDVAVLTATMTGHAGPVDHLKAAAPSSGAGSAGVSRSDNSTSHVRPRSQNDYWAFSACTDLLVCVLDCLPPVLAAEWVPRVLHIVAELVSRYSHEYRLYTLACVAVHAIRGQLLSVRGVPSGGAGAISKGTFSTLKSHPMSHSSGANGELAAIPKWRDSISSLAQVTLQSMPGFQGAVLFQAIRFLCSLPPELSSLATLLATFKALLGSGAALATERPDLIVLAIEALDSRMEIGEGLSDYQLSELLPVLLQLLDSDDGAIEGLQSAIAPDVGESLRINHSSEHFSRKGLYWETSATIVRSSLRKFSADPSIRIRDAQLRLVALVGKLGPRSYVGVPSVKDALLAEASWTSTTPGEPILVRANLPVEAFISIDVLRLIPRLEYLAQTGNTKQVKVSALEALHTCYMIVIGHPSVTPDILSRVFVSAESLAASSDSVAVQLFSPLLGQLLRLLCYQRSDDKKWQSLLRCWDYLQCSMLHPSSHRRNYAAKVLSQSGCEVLSEATESGSVSLFTSIYDGDWIQAAGGGDSDATGSSAASGAAGSSSSRSSSAAMSDDGRMMRSSDASETQHPIESWFIRLDRVFRSSSAFAKAAAATCLHDLLPALAKRPHLASVISPSILAMVLLSLDAMTDEKSSTSPAFDIVASTVDRLRVLVVRTISYLGRSVVSPSSSAPRSSRPQILLNILDCHFIAYVMKLGAGCHSKAGKKAMQFAIAVAALDEAAASGVERRGMAYLAGGLQRRVIPGNVQAECSRLLSAWVVRHAEFKLGISAEALVRLYCEGNSVDATTKSDEPLSPNSIQVISGVLTSLRNMTSTGVIPTDLAYSPLLSKGSSGGELPASIATAVHVLLEQLQSPDRALGTSRDAVGPVCACLSELQYIAVMALKLLPGVKSDAAHRSTKYPLSIQLLAALGYKVLAGLAVDPVQMLAPCANTTSARSQFTKLWLDSQSLLELLDYSWRLPAWHLLPKMSVGGKDGTFRDSLLAEIISNVGSPADFELAMSPRVEIQPSNRRCGPLFLLLRLLSLSPHCHLLKAALPYLSSASGAGGSWVGILYEDYLGEKLLALDDAIMFSETHATVELQQHSYRLLVGCLALAYSARSGVGVASRILRFFLAASVESDDTRVLEASARMALFGNLLTWPLIAAKFYEEFVSEALALLRGGSENRDSIAQLVYMILAEFEARSIGGSVMPTQSILADSLFGGSDQFAVASRLARDGGVRKSTSFKLEAAGVREQLSALRRLVTSMAESVLHLKEVPDFHAATKTLGLLHSALALEASAREAHHMPLSASVGLLEVSGKVLCGWLHTAAVPVAVQEQFIHLYRDAVRQLVPYLLPGFSVTSPLRVRAVDDATSATRDAIIKNSEAVERAISSGIVSRSFPISWNDLEEAVTPYQMQHFRSSAMLLLQVFESSGCLSLLYPDILGRLLAAPPSAGVNLHLDVALRSAATTAAHVGDSAVTDCLLGETMGPPGFKGSSYRGLIGSILRLSFSTEQESKYYLVRTFISTYLYALPPRQLLLALTSKNPEIGQCIAFCTSRSLTEDLDLDDFSQDDYLKLTQVWFSFASLTIVFEKLEKEDIESQIQPCLFMPSYKLAKSIRDSALKVVKAASGRSASASSSFASKLQLDKLKDDIIAAAVVCWSRAVGQTYSQSKWLAQVFHAIPAVLHRCINQGWDTYRYLSDPTQQLPELVVSSSSSVLSLPPLPRATIKGIRVALGSATLADLDTVGLDRNGNIDRSRYLYLDASGDLGITEFDAQLAQARGITGVTQALGIGTQVPVALSEGSQDEYRDGSVSMDSEGSTEGRNLTDASHDDVAAEINTIYEAVELDADSSSVVYFALLRLVDVLIDEFSVSAERRGGPPSALREGEEPRWVHYLSAILEDSSLPVEVRAMIARLVLTRSAALRPLRLRLLIPVLQVAAETLPPPRRHMGDRSQQQKADEQRQADSIRFGPGIHHFARDVAELCLEWSPVDLYRCKCQAAVRSLEPGGYEAGWSPAQIVVSSFVNRFIGNCVSTDSVVNRSNRRLALALIETFCVRSGLYEQQVGQSEADYAYRPPILRLDLNPLCLMVVTQDALRNRGAELSMQDTAAALALDCMQKAAVCGATLHAGDSSAGMGWKDFERSFLMNAIPTVIKGIRLPSGKVLRRSKREAIVFRSYRLLGSIQANAGNKVVPSFDVQAVLALLRKQTLGTTDYSPLLFLRAMCGLLEQAPTVADSGLLGTIVGLGAPPSVTSKKQSAVAMKTAAACVECLVAAHSSAKVEFLSSLAVPTVRVICLCISAGREIDTKNAITALSMICNNIPGEVVLRIIGVEGDVAIPPEYRDAIGMLRGATALGRSANAPALTRAVLELLVHLLKSHPRFMDDRVDAVAGAREMLQSADEATRARALRELLVSTSRDSVVEPEAASGGGSSSSSESSLRNHGLYLLYQAASRDCDTWDDVHLASDSSVTTALLRYLYPSAGIVLPGLPGTLVSMLSQMFPGSGYRTVGYLLPKASGARAQQAWLRCCAAIVGVMASRTASNSAKIHHDLHGNESLQEIDVHVGLTYAAASVFEGDDRASSGSSLDPSAVASLLPQGTTGTRSNRISTFCSQASQIGPVYEMSEWNGPSVDPEVATYMLRHAFASVGLSYDSDAAMESQVAVSSDRGAAEPPYSESYVQAYTSAPLYRISTQGGEPPVWSGRRKARVDPELAVPRRVARTLWKDHLKSSYTYSRNRRPDDYRVALLDSSREAATLHLKYRVGKLPDVAVSASDLIVPLTILSAQNDDIAAMIVGAAVYRLGQLHSDAVVAGGKQSSRGLGAPSDAGTAVDLVAHALERLPVGSSASATALVESLENVCFGSESTPPTWLLPAIPVKPAALLPCRQAGHSPTAGAALLLEEYLLRDASAKGHLAGSSQASPPRKSKAKKPGRGSAHRRAQAAPEFAPAYYSTMQSAWSALLDAYGSLDEDALISVGISSAVSESTREATSKDCRGDLYGALKHYGEAAAASSAGAGSQSESQELLSESTTTESMDDSMASGDVDAAIRLPAECERHLWLLRYRNACEQLGRWKDLAQLSLSSGDSYLPAYSPMERFAVASWSELLDGAASSVSTHWTPSTGVYAQSMNLSTSVASGEWLIPAAALALSDGNRVVAGKMLDLAVYDGLLLWRTGSQFDSNSRSKCLQSLWFCIELSERMASLIRDDVPDCFSSVIRGQLQRSLISRSIDLFAAHKSARLRNALLSPAVRSCLPPTTAVGPDVLDLATAASVSSSALVAVATLRSGHYKAATRLCRQVTQVQFPHGGPRSGTIVMRANSPAAVMLIGTQYIRSYLYALREASPMKSVSILTGALKIARLLESTFTRGPVSALEAARPVVASLRFELASAALSMHDSGGKGAQVVWYSVQAALNSRPTTELAPMDGDEIVDRDPIGGLLSHGIALHGMSLRNLLYSIASTAASGQGDRSRTATEYLAQSHVAFAQFAADAIRAVLDARVGLAHPFAGSLSEGLSGLSAGAEAKAYSKDPDHGGIFQLVQLHTRSVIAGIRLGSQQASALFPSVLSFVDSFCESDAVRCFASEVRNLQLASLEEWTPYLVAFASASRIRSLEGGNVEQREASTEFASALARALRSVGAVAKQRVAVLLRCLDVDDSASGMPAIGQSETEFGSTEASPSSSSHAGSKRRRPSAASAVSETARSASRASKRPRRSGSAASSADSSLDVPGIERSDAPTVSLSTRKSALAQLFAPVYRSVHSPVLHTFLDCVEDLQSPYLRVLDWVKKSVREAKGVHSSVRDAFVAYRWPAFCEWVQRSGSRSAPRLVRDSMLICDSGSILKRAMGGKTGPPSFVEVQKWSKTLSGIKQMGPAHSSTNVLRDLSPWLARYRANLYSLSDQIELPLAWTGSRLLESTNHRPYVQSLSPNLLVLRSLRVPRRVTLYCSDDASYRFLAKAGEDIRLDNRICAMLESCNRLAATSPASRQRQLYVKTYAAIPTSRNAGLIEWVDGTDTLMGVLASNASIPGWNALQHDPEALAAADAVRSKTTYPKLFVAPFDASARVEAAYDTATQKTAAGSIRETIRYRSSNASSFFSRRNVFMRSLSATTASTYLLGLGDRHLENFLVATNSMTIFPIDFGAAFGLARCLPVPELIPVRCSPCFRRVTGPVDGKFLMHVHLNHLFESILSPSGVGELSSLLDVFVAEPLADWESAVMAAQSTAEDVIGLDAEDGGSFSSSESGKAIEKVAVSADYAIEKVAVARMRLRRTHPADVHALELRKNTKLPNGIISAMIQFMQAAGNYSSYIPYAEASSSTHSSASGPGTGALQLPSAFELAAVVLSMSTDASICSR